MINALYGFGAFYAFIMLLGWCMCRSAGLADAKAEKMRSERR